MTSGFHSGQRSTLTRVSQTSSGSALISISLFCCHWGVAIDVHLVGREQRTAGRSHVEIRFGSRESRTAAWRDLPEEIRAHLISHPAQPAAGEMPASDSIATLPPTFAGARRDLPLNRVPPREFTIA